MHICLLPKVNNNLLLLILLHAHSDIANICFDINPPSLFNIKKACKPSLISATATTSADHRLKYIIWTPDVHVGIKPHCILPVDQLTQVLAAGK